MGDISKIIVFTLEDIRCGLALDAVERVVRVVEITSLPGELPMLLGVINVQGEVVPVLDICQRFGLALRPIQLSDQLIITRVGVRTLALKVADVCEVRDYRKSELTSAAAIYPHLSFITGVVKASDGLIIIQDLNQLLSVEESNIISELVEMEVP